MSSVTFFFHVGRPSVNKSGQSVLKSWKYTVFQSFLFNLYLLWYLPTFCRGPSIVSAPLSIFCCLISVTECWYEVNPKSTSMYSNNHVKKLVRTFAFYSNYLICGLHVSPKAHFLFSFKLRVHYPKIYHLLFVYIHTVNVIGDCRCAPQQILLVSPVSYLKINTTLFRNGKSKIFLPSRSWS